MKKRIKGYYQYNQEDCGAACLATILKYHGIDCTLSNLRSKMKYDKSGANILSITEISKEFNINAEAYEGDYNELKQEIILNNFKLPMILHLKLNSNEGHFIVLKKIKNDILYIFDPKNGHSKMSVEKLLTQWTGIIICFEKSINYLSSSKERVINRYINMIFNQKINLIITILLSLLITLVTLLGTFVYKEIIDNYIMNDNVKSYSNNIFNYIFVIMILFYVFQSLLYIFKNFLTNHLSKNLSNHLSKSFIQHHIYIPENNSHYFDSGEVLSRFQSITQIQQYFLKIIFTLSTEIIATILGAVILYFLNVELFLYSLLMISLYFLTLYYFLPKLKKIRNEHFSLYSESITEFNKNILGKPTIVMSSKQRWFLNKTYIKIKNSNDKLFENGIVEGYITSCIMLIESIGALLILWRGSILVLNNHMTLGELVIFQSMLASFILPIQQLALLQNDSQNLKILINRLDDLFNISIEKMNITNSNVHIDNYDIELTNIGFSYKYKEPIFHNISLHIRSGDKVVISGTSGSGKSTLLKLVASLYSPEEGAISIGEVPYDSTNLTEIRKYISYVDQDTFIFESSLKENLTFGIDLNTYPKELFNEILSICGIFEFIPSNENIETFKLYENGINLSGGQKQKIGIARALIKNPKILLLDESTSNLDEKAKYNILNYIFSKKDLTVLFVTHDYNLLKFSDYIINANDGFTYKQI